VGRKRAGSNLAIPAAHEDWFIMDRRFLQKTSKDLPLWFGIAPGIELGGRSADDVGTFIAGDFQQGVVEREQRGPDFRPGGEVADMFFSVNAVKC
jgi:hypothetical protein